MRWCGVPDKAYRFGDRDAVVVRLPANDAADDPKTAKRRAHATKVRVVRIVVGLRAEVCPHGATALRYNWLKLPLFSFV